MSRVVLASALSRWLPEGAAADAPGETAIDVEGRTVGEALDAVFARHPTLRGYVTDELGHPRHHIAIFLDGSALPRRNAMQAPLGGQSEIHVMQALSGG
jgi:sulfur carrier protein ThiS